MLKFSTVSEIKAFVKKQKNVGKTIGFVPTMGALHQGHLNLMKRAKKENDLLVVSIFVNPIQFNNKEDLVKYPRNLNNDIDLLKSVGCDVLFAPSTTEMYPDKIKKQYNFGLLENVMEGASRPGHFNGVAIVVNRLFNIVLPNKAYFGEKDFQQLAIIQQLVQIENIKVEIVPCSTVREDDGLAMSSRNQHLTPEQRKVAPTIYKLLTFAKKQSKVLSPDLLKTQLTDMFNAIPEFELEYFEIADDNELQPITSWNKASGIIAFAVVKLGNVRLIDNIRII